MVVEEIDINVAIEYVGSQEVKTLTSTREQLTGQICMYYCYKIAKKGNHISPRFHECMDSVEWSCLYCGGGIRLGSAAA
jgi:hypothetical protein